MSISDMFHRNGSTVIKRESDRVRAEQRRLQREVNKFDREIGEKKTLARGAAKRGDIAKAKDLLQECAKKTTARTRTATQAKLLEQQCYNMDEVRSGVVLQNSMKISTKALKRVTRQTMSGEDRTVDENQKYMDRMRDAQNQMSEAFMTNSEQETEQTEAETQRLLDELFADNAFLEQGLPEAEVQSNTVQPVAESALNNIN